MARTIHHKYSKKQTVWWQNNYIAALNHKPSALPEVAEWIEKYNALQDLKHEIITKYNREK